MPGKRKKEKKHLSWEIYVTGTNYHQDDLMELAYNNIESPPEEGCATINSYYFIESPVELIPEPKNQYDKNAIKVLVNKIWIGYIPADLCLEVKELMKNCNVEHISCRIEGGMRVSWKDRQVTYSDERRITAKVRIFYEV